MNALLKAVSPWWAGGAAARRRWPRAAAPVAGLLRRCRQHVSLFSPSAVSVAGGSA